MRHLNEFDFTCILQSPDWKQIIYKNEPTQYYVSRFGEIFSFKSFKFLKLKPNSPPNCMYLVFTVQSKNITLGTKQENALVHKIVASNWIPNPDPLVKCCVNHRDGNVQNNNVDNLEWCSHEDNAIHARDNLDTIGNNVIVTNVFTGEEQLYTSMRQAARAIGVTLQVISRAAKSFNNTTRNGYKVRLVHPDKKKASGYTPIPVIMWFTKKPETATYYPSITKAAKALKLCLGNIHCLVTDPTRIAYKQFSGRMATKEEIIKYGDNSILITQGN